MKKLLAVAVVLAFGYGIASAELYLPPKDGSTQPPSSKTTVIRPVNQQIIIPNAAQPPATQQKEDKVEAKTSEGVTVEKGDQLEKKVGEVKKIVSPDKQEKTVGQIIKTVDTVENQSGKEITNHGMSKKVENDMKKVQREETRTKVEKLKQMKEKDAVNVLTKEENRVAQPVPGANKKR